MTIEEVKSSVLKKVRKVRTLADLRKIEKFIDKPEKASELELSQKMKGKIEASRHEIENGKYIENKLLRKEVRIWLKNR